MKDWKEVVKEGFENRIYEHTADIVGNYKKKNPVRVKIDNRYFLTAKGKTIWSDIGPAKNALRIHLLDTSSWTVNQGKRYGDPDYIGYNELRSYVEEIYQEFLKTRVTFEFLEK